MLDDYFVLIALCKSHQHPYRFYSSHELFTDVSKWSHLFSFFSAWQKHTPLTRPPFHKESADGKTAVQYLQW